MLRVGQTVGAYEVVEELGHGGMAALFLGREIGSERRVALKVMHAEVATDLETQKMFLDEARLSACIRHPNVVHVERIAEHEGTPYLVMEHIPGADLAAVLRARARDRAHLPVPLAVAIAAQIAEGLHAAHESTDELGQPLGIVHRDVSPGNVLIDRAGTVKVIDFGIARARTRLAKTTPGSVKGKLAYMAPEQLEGKAFDRRVDVFALGVVLWEMLVLRRLFYAPTDLDTILRIREPSPVEAPSRHRGDVPSRLDDVIATMLARDLEERFCTTQAARHALLVACPEAREVDAASIGSLATLERRDPIVEDRTRVARPSAKS